MFWLGAIVSLCYVPGVTGASIATQWPVLSILLPFALWRAGPFTAWHALGLLFLGCAAVQLSWSPIFFDGVFGFWLLCIMALSFWLGTMLEDPRQLYAGLALGAGVSSFVAVLQFFGFNWLPVYDGTPAGIYYNHVAQGMILALVAVALLSERMWLWTLPLLPGIALANSRGAFVALAVGIAALYVRHLWLYVTGSAVFVYVMLTAPWLGKSDAQRVFIWESLWQWVTPWGWGPGSIFPLQLYNPVRGFFNPEYAHNDVLQLVFEHGLAAALPLAVLAFVLTRTAAREWPVLVAFAVAGCYFFPLWVPVTSFLAMVVAGRVVRDWAVARGVGNRSGPNVMAWVPS